MANLAEDENPRVIDKPYPRCGERWLHPDSGHVVTVWRLCIGRWGLSKNLDFMVFAKGPEIGVDDQCVIFQGSNNYYIRTVENFLERFERVG